MLQTKRIKGDSLTFDQEWMQLPVRAAVPSQDYLEVTGPAPTPHDDRRRSARYRCRGRAILQRESERFAGYTADVSPTGMGIISPVQLLPKEHVEITTFRQKVPLIVIWCRRLGKDCYQCGCQFEE